MILNLYQTIIAYSCVLFFVQQMVLNKDSRINSAAMQGPLQFLAKEAKTVNTICPYYKD